MLRELIGFAVGVYIAQNYHVPDVYTILKEFQNTLIKYQKSPPKK